jgi:outer membrane protein TolC
MTRLCRIHLFFIGLLLAPVLGHGADSSPLTWSRCVNLAVEHNTEFKLAQIRLEETEGVILEKRAAFLPKAQAGTVTLPPTLAFGFVQPIYSTAMAPAFRSFRTGRSAARINAQLTLLELIYRLRIAFARALYAAQLAEIQRKDLNILKDRLKRAPALFEAEKMQKKDVTELEVRTKLTEERWSRAVKGQDLARLDLIEVIGTSTGSRDGTGQPSGSLEDRIPDDLNLDRLVTRAREKRLDLQLARKLKLLADERILITRSEQYPLPYAFGNTVLTENNPRFLKSLTDALDPQSAEQDDINRDIIYARATIGVGISWRVFDGGEMEGKIQGARAEAAKQDVLVRELERAIPLQVEQAAKALQSVLKLTDQLKKSNFKPVDVQIARALFEGGQTSQLEILDALQQNIRFEEATLMLSYYRSLALASLDRATGDGIQILDESQQNRIDIKIDHSRTDSR